MVITSAGMLSEDQKMIFSQFFGKWLKNCSFLLSLSFFRQKHAKKKVLFPMLEISYKCKISTSLPYGLWQKDTPYMVYGKKILRFVVYLLFVLSLYYPLSYLCFLLWYSLNKCKLKRIAWVVSLSFKQEKRFFLSLLFSVL